MTTPPAPAPTRAPTAGRFPGPEVGRWGAACGIVWLHAAFVGADTSRAASYGRFAVPFFTLLAVALTVRSVAAGRGATFWSFARDRAVRLYVPFLFWTAVYLALRYAKSKVFGSPRPHPDVSLLAVGSALHLWYLPFILIATVAARAVAPAALSCPRWAAVGVLLVAGAASVADDLQVPYDPNDPDPANQIGYLWNLSARALPSVLWGLALGLGFDAVVSRLTGRWWVVAAGLVACASLLWLAGDYRGSGVGWLCENAAGAVFFVAAAALPNRAGVRSLARLGAYSYGVYLLHPAFIQAGEKLFHTSRDVLGMDNAVKLAALGLVGATAGTWVLLHVRRLAWTVR